MLDFYWGQTIILFLPMLWAAGYLLEIKDKKLVRVYSFLGMFSVFAYLVRLLWYNEGWPSDFSTTSVDTAVVAGHYLFVFGITKLSSLIVLLNYFVTIILLLTWHREEIYDSRSIMFMQMVILGLSTLALSSTNIFQYYLVSELVVYTYLLLISTLGNKESVKEILVYASISSALVLASMVILLVVGKISFGVIELSDEMVRRFLGDEQFAKERLLVGAMLLLVYLMKMGIFPLKHWSNKTDKKISSLLNISLVVIYDTLFIFGLYKYFFTYFYAGMTAYMPWIIGGIILSSAIGLLTSDYKSNTGNFFLRLARIVIVLMILSPSNRAHEGAFYILFIISMLNTFFGALTYHRASEFFFFPAGLVIALYVFMIMFPFSAVVGSEYFFLSTMLENGLAFLLASLLLLLYGHYIFIKGAVATLTSAKVAWPAPAHLQWRKLMPLILLLAIIFFMGILPENIIAFFRADLVM